MTKYKKNAHGFYETLVWDNTYRGWSKAPNRITSNKSSKNPEGNSYHHTQKRIVAILPHYPSIHFHNMPITAWEVPNSPPASIPGKCTAMSLVSALLSWMICHLKSMEILVSEIFTGNALSAPPEITEKGGKAQYQKRSWHRKSPPDSSDMLLSHMPQVQTR